MLELTCRNTTAQQPPRTHIYTCATQHGWELDERDHRQTRYRRGDDRLLVTFTVDERVSCAKYRLGGVVGEVGRHDKGKVETVCRLLVCRCRSVMCH